MSGSAVNPRTPVDDYERISVELKAITDRLDSLEAPTGTSMFRTVAKLEALVADIQAQLDIYNAARYTNAAIDAKDAVVNANIATTIASTLAGNVTVGGEFRNPPAYSFDITYTRRTAWIGNDGRLGYASSAVAGKTALKPAGIDTDAVLALEPTEWYYRRELARRTSLRINEGVDYRPAREVGLLGEQVAELGLEWLVYRDEHGNIEGLEYSMLAVALLAVARNEHDARIALEERVAKLEAAAS